MSNTQNGGLETCSSAASFEATRRKFLMWIIGVFSCLAALFLAVPLIGNLVGPVFRVKKLEWTKVGNVGSLAIDQPVNMKFPFRTEDAYIRETVTQNVWVIKHSPSEVTVFSPICPHLGCHYDWDPGTKEFACPCHGSIYSIDGKVLGGPAPRPLDTLPTRLEKGELFVEWEEFKVGISEKVRI
jgi:menaquinol-cytochrome c reductase iron-sulfur subunit